MLLRIVATAGAGALLGVAACGTDSTALNGAIASVGQDAAEAQSTEDDASNGVAGFVGMANGFVDAGVLDDDGGDAADGAGQDAARQDASAPNDAGEDAGNDAASDASRDAEVSDSAIRDAADEVEVLHCPPVCGIIVHP
jgi:hypothetical protein